MKTTLFTMAPGVLDRMLLATRERPWSMFDVERRSVDEIVTVRENGTEQEANFLVVSAASKSNRQGLYAIALVSVVHELTAEAERLGLYRPSPP